MSGDLENPAAATIERVSRWATEQADLEIVVVYGSFAAGTASTASDLDVAVAGEHPLTADRLVTIIDEVSRRTDREVDVIDLGEATGTILQEALTRGVFVKRSNAATLARIFKRMWFDREDFEKSRERMQEARRKRVFNGKSGGPGKT